MSAKDYQKDYYKALGVPKTATAAEIKNVRGGRFRGRTGPAGRTRRGADVETETTLGFGDAIDGATVSLRLTGEGPCPDCHGTGARTGTVPKVCPDCQGTGQQSRNLGGFGLAEPCKTCRGRGLVVEDPCPSCSGSGRAMSSRTIPVRIPAGVADGQRIRIPGKGAPGEHGGKPGDLFVRVRVTPHPVFARSGDNLTVTVPVTITELALGAEIKVPPHRGSAVRAHPGGHTERSGVPRPRPRRQAQGREHRRPARHRAGHGPAGAEQQGQVGTRGSAHRHGGRGPARGAASPGPAGVAGRAVLRK